MPGYLSYHLPLHPFRSLSLSLYLSIYLPLPFNTVYSISYPPPSYLLHFLFRHLTLLNFTEHPCHHLCIIMMLFFLFFVLFVLLQLLPLLCPIPFSICLYLYSLSLISLRYSIPFPVLFFSPPPTFLFSTTSALSTSTSSTLYLFYGRIGKVKDRMGMK